MSECPQKSTKPNALFKATELCRFHLKGRCTRGSECTFAHGHEQLRQRPDLYKTQMCVQFTMQGWCQNQGRCDFAHAVEELRRRRGKQNQRPPKLNEDEVVALEQLLVTPAAVQLPVNQAGPCLHKAHKPRPCLLDAQHRLDPYASAFCENQDDAESLSSTKCTSETKSAVLGKTSLTAEHTPYNGFTLDDLESQSDELEQPMLNKQTGAIQLDAQPEMASMMSSSQQDPRGKLVVKNTFFNFEDVSKSCAKNRSRSS